MAKSLPLALLLLLSGLAHAGVKEGEEAYDKGDYKTALQEFKKTPKDARAMAWIASMYFDGHGVKKDVKVAASLMEKAAIAGDSFAQHELGFYLRDGTGVKKDLPKAAAWMQKAVDAGYADAFAALGYMYRYGTGVAVNTDKALELYRLGAELKDADAQAQLGQELYRGEIVQQDLAQARQLLQAAFDANGDAEAAISLGYMYYAGLGGSKDLSRSLQMYKAAADAGRANAQFSLGVLFAGGQGVAADTDQAIYWYKRAIEGGNADAQKNLLALQKSLEEKRLREAQAVAEQERLLIAKRSLGTMLCSSGAGTTQEYSGYVILGKPYYKKVDGTVRIAVYVEQSAPPMLSLRVARLDFMYPDGRMVDMATLDSEWGQLAPNRIFWSNEGKWERCT